MERSPVISFLFHIRAIGEYSPTTFWTQWSRSSEIYVRRTQNLSKDNSLQAYQNVSLLFQLCWGCWVSWMYVSSDMLTTAHSSKGLQCNLSLGLRSVSSIGNLQYCIHGTPCLIHNSFLAVRNFVDDGADNCDQVFLAHNRRSK